MANSISIVDVSKWQLVTPKACETTHLFITKACQGQKKYDPDPQLENTYNVVRADKNTAFSPYHYWWRNPSDVGTGKKQAEQMARILENLVSVHGGKFSDLKYNGKPLVWLDVDPVYTAGGEPEMSQNQMENGIWKFIYRIDELLGAEVGIYTSQYAWTSVTGPGHNRSTDIPKDRPLWVSNPKTSGSPLIPWDWEKRYGLDCWKIWQHSFTGKIPGIMKPNSPTVIATVDLNRANGSLEWFNSQFNTDLAPKSVVVTPPPPVVIQPDRIEIEIQGADTLNLRSTPFGTIVAKTWDGVQFPVIGRADDGQGRPWWKIAPEMYVASWYCKGV